VLPEDRVLGELGLQPGPIFYRENQTPLVRVYRAPPPR
jgi:hypothetical protein